MSTTENDGDVVFAIALSISAQRDLFRDDLETVAEKHGCSVSELIETITWLRKATAAYRGTEVMAAAERLATALRHGRRSDPQAKAGPIRSGRTTQAPRIISIPNSRAGPKRGCARCRRRFQPTARRRLLCAACFFDDGHDQAGALAGCDEKNLHDPGLRRNLHSPRTMLDALRPPAPERRSAGYVDAARAPCVRFRAAMNGTGARASAVTTWAASTAMATRWPAVHLRVPGAPCRAARKSTTRTDCASIIAMSAGAPLRNERGQVGPFDHPGSESAVG